MDYARHNDEVIDYYDRRVKKTMTPTGNLYTQHHLDELQRVTGIGPGDRVLDVGCGMGRYTIPLAARGVHVEGLDLSAFLLERLKEYNDSGRTIPTYCLDILDHPPAMEGAYDAVVGFFMLHHLHDLERCFAAAMRLVKPGGAVAFVEPNAYNVLYYVQIVVTPTMTWKGDKGIARMRPGVIFPAMRVGRTRVSSRCTASGSSRRSSPAGLRDAARESVSRRCGCGGRCCRPRCSAPAVPAEGGCAPAGPNRAAPNATGSMKRPTRIRKDARLGAEFHGPADTASAKPGPAL